MVRQFASCLLLFSGIFIALGGIGHSYSGIQEVRLALRNPDIPEAIAKLVVVVWHFAGGAMVTLGLIVIGSWRRLRRGDTAGLFPAQVIGLSYVLYGVAAMRFTDDSFFSAFVVLGVLVVIASRFLARTAAPATA